MNEINNFCDTEPCLHMTHVTHCSMHDVLHHRPILKDCPCKECIVRPVCDKKCEIRKLYACYIIEHLYEESKANHIKKLGENKNIEDDFENIVIVHDPSTYDITLRM